MSVIIQVDELITETDKAYHVDCEGDKVWLPKSQVTLDMSKNQVEIPDWLFKQKFPDG